MEKNLCYLLLFATLVAVHGKDAAVYQMSVGKEKVLNELDLTSFRDCHALHKAGYNISGTYKIKVEESELLVPCEFRDGMGYTVFLQRFDASLSFMQQWGPYETGFGHPGHNYWLGLLHIYALTLTGQSGMYLQMQDWRGRSYTLSYSTFHLGPRDQRYRLYVGPARGTIVDDLSYHNGMPFSTFEAPDPNHCATHMKAGWWYNYCAYTLPTGYYYQGGPYHPGNYSDGIFWKDLYGYNYSMKFISMAIAPRVA